MAHAEKQRRGRCRSSGGPAGRRPTDASAPADRRWCAGQPVGEGGRGIRRPAEPRGGRTTFSRSPLVKGEALARPSSKRRQRAGKLRSRLRVGGRIIARDHRTKTLEGLGTIGLCKPARARLLVMNASPFRPTGCRQSCRPDLLEPSRCEIPRTRVRRTGRTPASRFHDKESSRVLEAVNAKKQA